MEGHIITLFSTLRVSGRALQSSPILWGGGFRIHVIWQEETVNINKYLISDIENNEESDIHKTSDDLGIEKHAKRRYYERGSVKFQETPYALHVSFEMCTNNKGN